MIDINQSKLLHAGLSCWRVNICLDLQCFMSFIWYHLVELTFKEVTCCVPCVTILCSWWWLVNITRALLKIRISPHKGTFTLCPSPCPSPCPYQSPCPNNSHFLMKLEAVFRLHQFPYQSPIQCHQISVRSVSIGPPTVKNWYGRPFPSESCKSLYKITLWRLARQLWTWN